jgi:hypothetical protein
MDCCLTSDDAFVVGGSEDGYVFFWELVDAPVVARFRAHSSVVFFFPELKTICFLLQLLIVYQVSFFFQFFCSLFSLLYMILFLLAGNQHKLPPNEGLHVDIFCGRLYSCLDLKTRIADVLPVLFLQIIQLSRSNGKWWMRVVTKLDSCTLCWCAVKRMCNR